MPHPVPPAGRRPAAENVRLRLRPAPLARLAALRHPQLTGRSMMILAMSLFLVVVLASPLQTYFSRRSALSATQRQQQQLAKQVAQLQHQSDQWNDPAYVARQARIRLQYVRPGDTLYTVLNPDGSARTEVAPAAGTVKKSGSGGSWNTNLWSSVTGADANP